jgi:hypothetical protein
MSTATTERIDVLRRAGGKGQQHRLLRAQTRAWLREPADTWESRDRLARILLGDPLPHLQTLQVGELLSYCHGVSEIKARRILRTVGLEHGLKIVGKLTERQLRHLAGVLRHGYHDQAEMFGSRRP